MTRRLDSRAIGGAILLAAALAVDVAIAQAPSVAGTWRLDSARSTVDVHAVLAGLAPAAAPGMLHITQPANGTLVIESEVNEGHVRLYKPGGTTTTPVGQGGTITMTSTWDGGTLVSEGRQESPSGTAASVREVLALAADRSALTIKVTSTAGGESAGSTLVYTRATDVGPCERWPTPCKRPKN